MVRVIRRGRFSIYVLPENGGRHHLPHCHIVWSDGRSVLELPTFRLLAGHPLPALPGTSFGKPRQILLRRGISSIPRGPLDECHDFDP